MDELSKGTDDFKGLCYKGAIMINGELIVDNFAGGGGASTGIEIDRWYYCISSNDERDIRYNSLWNGIKFKTQEECVIAC